MADKFSLVSLVKKTVGINDNPEGCCGSQGAVPDAACDTGATASECGDQCCPESKNKLPPAKPVSPEGESS